MKRILEPPRGSSRRHALASFLAAVLVMALAGRAAAAAAVQVATEPGPSDMVGRWSGEFTQGDRAGQRAADLAIALVPNGPEIELTMYRYEDGVAKPQTEHPPVVEHRVEKGVLHFRTRDKRSLGGGPPEQIEADWSFSVIGNDAGVLRVSVPKLAAERAQGKDVPPPPPPLPMKRVRR